MNEELLKKMYFIWMDDAFNSMEIVSIYWKQLLKDYNVEIDEIFFELYLDEVNSKSNDNFENFKLITTKYFL